MELLIKLHQKSSYAWSRSQEGHVAAGMRRGLGTVWLRECSERGSEEKKRNPLLIGELLLLRVECVWASFMVISPLQGVQGDPEQPPNNYSSSSIRDRERCPELSLPVSGILVNEIIQGTLTFKGIMS